MANEQRSPEQRSPERKARFRLSCFAIIERDGRYLLARRSDIGWWNLAGGGMEFGETILDCLHREVREEVGVEVERVRQVGVYTKTRKPEVVFTFLCRLAPGSPAPCTSDEVSEVGWFGPAEFPEHLLPKHRRRLLDALRDRSDVIYGVETTSTEEDQGLDKSAQP